LVVREEEENKAARATVDINTTKIWALDKPQVIAYINHHRGTTDSTLWDDTLVQLKSKAKTIRDKLTSNKKKEIMRKKTGHFLIKII